MLVRELIDRLEASGLLDQEILETLRMQLEESGARVTPEAVVKLLVDNGHLTRFQATKLIGDLRADDAPAAAEVVQGGGNSDADLLLADDDAVAVDTGDGDAAIILDDDADVADAVIVDDDEPIAEAVAVPLDAEPIEAQPVAARGSMADLAPHPVVPTGDRPGKPKKNVWDSVWIYGVAGIVVALMLGGAALVFYITRESADEFIVKADEAYDGANFTSARDIYTDFLENYPGDKSVSKARVRVGISQIVLARKSVGDAYTGLKKAKEIFPTIETETAFEGERDVVANLLVDIGEKLAEEADGLKVSDEKATTLSQLDEWFELLENPMYMSGAMRQNFSTRITTIEETRARVVRDISRDRDLVKAVGEMRAAVDAKETKQAYDIRKELVRKYPRLGDHPDLAKLVLEASGIQQNLVKASSNLPAVSTEEVAAPQMQAVMLTNRIGTAIPELANRVVYFRARGSIWAVDAETGNIRWRRYVGYESNNPPVSLGDAPTDGVLLSDGVRGELQRISDNAVQWRSQFGEAFNSPIVDGGTVYVTTASGKLFAIDSETGDARWGRELPQPIPVAPGRQAGGSYLYVPGEHSNLYVLESSTGKCIQSYYMGHDVGTIRVAPVPLLGHLFVFENAGSDYCLVHFLKIDEATGQLSPAQANQRLSGNVTTNPEVQGRRMMVLTDLGQIMVFDVEPTAKNDKVQIAAQHVATYATPTDSKMAVGRNEMWVSGSQIARYELQINTGKVIRDWVLHGGDSFESAPKLVEGVLIHARQLRGTQGVRITAQRPGTGDGSVLWQNDVGVPVAMLAIDAPTRSVYGVTTQAALYQLDQKALSASGTVQPLENPDPDGVAMRFENPLDAGNGRRVLVNQDSSQQLVVFDPSRPREKLRLVTLSLTSGLRASAQPILMAGGLLMPMENGRIMLMNWESGMPLGSPFQPPTQPGQAVQWTTPVPNPSDPEQVLIANNSATLYRLRVGEQIRELSKSQLSKVLLGPAAASAGNWIAAAGGESGDTLMTYSVTTLEETGQRGMGSRIVFGPVSAGEYVLLQTVDGKLHRINETAADVWTLDLPSGQPIDTPLLADGKLIITGADGWILSVDPSSGEITGQIDVGQPLAGNPLIAGSQMLVPGSEGIVYVVARP